MADVLAATWTSLEVAKLIIAVATPVTVIFLGLLVKRAGRSIEDAQWASRQLIERRLELYNEMAPLFNDLYCAVRVIGDFRAITPPVAVERKRQLDKLFHVNRFLFEPAFHERYAAFMGTFFVMNESVGSVARLRAEAGRQRAERGSTWNDEWEPMLLGAGEDVPGRAEIDAAYNELLAEFADEVGFGARPGRAA